MQWRAPEVTETFFHAPADVFSFGILCWEVMTRKKPFEALEPVDVLRAIQDGKRCVARLYSRAFDSHVFVSQSTPHRRIAGRRCRTSTLDCRRTSSSGAGRTTR